MVSVDLAQKESNVGSGLAWRSAMAAPFIFWAILTLGGLALRPPTAPIELELLASTWHMYLNGGIVPIANGAPDFGIPPLTSWLTALCWRLLGETELWPRLAAAVAGLVTLVLIGRTAGMLWPHRAATPIFARLLLAGLAGFAISLTMIEPEMLALPFTLLAFHAMARMWLNRPEGRALVLARLQVMAGAIFSAFAAGWIWAGLPLLLGGLMPVFDQANAPPRLRRWFAETALMAVAAMGVLQTWLAIAAGLSGGEILSIHQFGNGWIDLATEASRRETWTLLLLPIVLYPWVCWKTLWRALARHLRETLGAGFRLSLAALAAIALASIVGGWKLQGMLPIAIPLSLLGARLLATQAIRPKDFHAVVPGFIALTLGLFFFLMNIIPTAHLDALWREVFGVPLPIWMGGVGLMSGLALLAIAYALTQMSPSRQISRTLQVATLPIVLMTSLNLEFASNLKPFFDLRPVAERLKTIQDAGRAVAVFGTYRGEFDFVGRLAASPTPLHSRQEAIRWANRNPGGAIVTYFDGSPIRLPALPIYRGVARDRFVAVWPASALIAEGGSAILNKQF